MNSQSESGNPGGAAAGVGDVAQGLGESGGGVDGGREGVMSDGEADARLLPPLQTAFQQLASAAGGGSQQEKDGVRWDLAQTAQGNDCLLQQRREACRLASWCQQMLLVKSSIAVSSR